MELGMLELAAAVHCEGFKSLSHLSSTAGGGSTARAPVDLSSLACGLVVTDLKTPNTKAPSSKAISNGGPWATLSEYLQQQIAAPEYEKHHRQAVPRPLNGNGRLDPQDEAVDKGWHFGNVSSRWLGAMNAYCRLCSHDLRVVYRVTMRYAL